jgi:nitrogen regulatory protein PII
VTPVSNANGPRSDVNRFSFHEDHGICRLSIGSDFERAMHRISRGGQVLCSRPNSASRCDIMKLVTTTVPAHVLDDLRDTLLSVGIKGMTIFPVRRRSPDETDAEFGRSRLCIFENALEIGLEMAVGSAIVNEVVRAIWAACNTAAPCGISILVSDVICGVRIRNSELVTEG